jgi:hypothetical protein
MGSEASPKAEWPIKPVSLVCLIFEVTTGGCRVLATKTNAAGLSRDSLPTTPSSIHDIAQAAPYCLNAESKNVGSAG